MIVDSISDSSTKLTVWSSTSTTVGVITKLVDVHASLCRGITAFDVIGNGRRGSLGGLLESNGTADGGITTKYCDCGRACCQQQIIQDSVDVGMDGWGATVPVYAVHTDKTIFYPIGRPCLRKLPTMCSILLEYLARMQKDSAGNHRIYLL